MTKPKTQSEWALHQEEAKKWAERQKIPYSSIEELLQHIKSCLGCSTTDKPYKFCGISDEIRSKLPPDDYFDLPMITCMHCKNEWQEEDYSDTKEDDVFTCQNCGFKHKVRGVAWTINVQLVATGEFDPWYMPEEDD